LHVRISVRSQRPGKPGQLAYMPQDKTALGLFLLQIGISSQ
jgi:hypothetical protein